MRLSRAIRYASTLVLLLGLQLAPLAAREEIAPLPGETYVHPGLPGLWTPGTYVTLHRSGLNQRPAQAFQWLHDGVPIPWATSDVLRLNPLTLADTGNYQLRVTVDGVTELSSTFVLNVVTPPSSPVDTSYVSGVTPEPRPDALPEHVVWPAWYNPLDVDALVTAKQPDGKFLIAQGSHIARINADGTIDSDFASTSPHGSTSSIYQVEVDRFGRIYVSARVSHLGNLPYSVTFREIVRLSPSGTLDASFARQQLVDGSRELGLSVLSDGRLLLFRLFQNPSWVMLRDDGSVDPSWSTTLLKIYASALAVDRANLRIFALISDADGAPARISRFLITRTGLEYDPTFFQGDGQATWIEWDADDRLYVNGTFASWDGHASANRVRLRADAVAPLPPRVWVQPAATAPAAGGPYTVTGSVSGAGPLTFQWLALDGQPLATTTNQPSLTIPVFTAAQFGRYQLKVTGPGGTVLSNVVELTPDPAAAPALLNLSGRARSGLGEDTVIAGLVTAAPDGLPVLMRAVGPGLAALGVTNALPNPALNVYDRRGEIVANNDEWSTHPECATTGAAVGAFALAENSHDAALVRTFPNGLSTAMLVSQGQATGVALLEVYRTASATSGRLLNLSFRARTGAGDDTAVAGFVIADPLGYGRTCRLLLRAIGPTLATQGITRPLSNPLLTVFNRRGEAIASNDDWATNNPSGNAATLASAMKQVGAFDLPAASQDAALLLDLPPGAYTMHAQGGDGVVLLEIYLIN